MATDVGLASCRGTASTTCTGPRSSKPSLLRSTVLSGPQDDGVVLHDDLYRRLTVDIRTNGGTCRRRSFGSIASLPPSPAVSMSSRAVKRSSSVTMARFDGQRILSTSAMEHNSPAIVAEKRHRHSRRRAGEQPGSSTAQVVHADHRSAARGGRDARRWRLAHRCRHGGDRRGHEMIEALRLGGAAGVFNVTRRGLGSGGQGADRATRRPRCGSRRRPHREGADHQRRRRRQCRDPCARRRRRGSRALDTTVAAPGWDSSGAARVAHGGRTGRAVPARPAVVRRPRRGHRVRRRGGACVHRPCRGDRRLRPRRRTSCSRVSTAGRTPATPCSTPAPSGRR